MTPIQLLSGVRSVYGGGGEWGSVVRGQEGITAFKNIFENAINDVRTTSDIKV